MISGIILAAGESSRMGEIKALLDYEGKTFIETILDNFEKNGINEIIVVLGFHKEKIGPAIKKNNITIAINRNPEEGQLSSLKAGIKKISKKSTGALITPVDQPAINPETYKTLIKESEKNPGKIIRVSYGGKHGHPLVIPKNLFEKLLEFPQKFTTRDFIKNHADLIIELEIDDAGIIKNYNYKEDLK